VFVDVVRQVWMVCSLLMDSSGLVVLGSINDVLRGSQQV
jgi:hypothetical protein